MRRLTRQEETEMAGAMLDDIWGRAGDLPTATRMLIRGVLSAGLIAVLVMSFPFIVWNRVKAAIDRAKRRAGVA